jgi:hypothetical protein
MHVRPGAVKQTAAPGLTQSTTGRRESMSLINARIKQDINARRYHKVIRHMNEVTIPYLELMLSVKADELQPPEVVVAGIEGRAIVRAGMARERRYIGEVS